MKFHIIAYLFLFLFASPVLAQHDSYTEGEIEIEANEGYEASALKEFFFGSSNRVVWTTPITAPILDIDQFTPEMQIGNRQTKSLVVKADDDKRYVLRSVNKDARAVVHPDWHGTIMEDILQDYVSVVHPYNYTIIPHLSESLGIYHTSPQVVYIPDSPVLGEYRSKFGGQLVIMEYFVGETHRDAKSIGAADEYIDDNELLNRLSESSNNQVDVETFFRARLLDFLIADWDRHKDQWLWAVYKQDGGELYKPVPLDRDWSFAQLNGLFTEPVLYVTDKGADFDDDFDSMKDMTINGMYQDRRLLAKLDKDDWDRITHEVKSTLTDEVIERSVKSLPESIYEIQGESIINTLKARRDNLYEASDKFYKLTHDVVDIVGSNDDEVIEIKRLDNEQTNVIVYQGTTVIYNRNILPNHTNEVRIYGLGGDDTFQLSGKNDGHVKIRVIGGSGSDELIDVTNDTGKFGLLLYDVEDTKISTDRTITLKLSDDPSVNEYDLREYQRNSLKFIPFASKESRGGMDVGTKFRYDKMGFRKAPYAQSHQGKINLSTDVRSLGVEYRSIFREVISYWDFVSDVTIFGPKDRENYYGLGNETDNQIDHFEITYRRIGAKPKLQVGLDEENNFYFGPTFEYVRISDIGDGDPDQLLDTSLDNQYYLGGETGFVLQSIDSLRYPTYGVRGSGNADFNEGIINSTRSYTKGRFEFEAYVPIGFIPSGVLAGRTGLEAVSGRYPFWDAAFLGEDRNFRGYDENRFAGDYAVYNNLEFRFKLMDFKIYILAAEVGAVSFVDYGRVWVKGEESDTWHHSYGGGLWFDFFDKWIFSTYLSQSADGSINFTAGSGFFF